MNGLMGFVAMLAIWAGPLVDGHVHKASHSGVIAHAGPYHLEVVVRDHVIQAWLLDGRERALSIPADSSLSMNLDPPLPLKKKEFRRFKDRFETPLDFDPSKGFSARAVLVIAGRKFDIAFRVSPLDLRDRLDDTLDRNGEKL